MYETFSVYMKPHVARPNTSFYFIILYTSIFVPQEVPMQV